MSKDLKILNLETKELVAPEFTDFIYCPAASLVRHFTNDKQFLLFRADNKNSKDWNYNLIADATENNNRRLAIMYVSQILEALELKFDIDGSYTLYVSNSELEKLTELNIPGAKEFYNGLYVPKQFAQKKGTSDTWQ